MCDYEQKKNIPLISYGIICYRKNEIDETEILLIRRKDTIGYIEFLRGKYNVDDDEYIIKLINFMTNEEKKRILEIKNFDMLRTLLGMNKKNSIHRLEYNEANIKFNKLLENNKIDELFSRSTTNWIYQEWGLPKGRKHQKETNMECAIREFREETLVSLEDIILLYNVKPLEESYKGINNVIYKHVYYFAEYDSDKDLVLDYTNDLQMTEISALKWCSLEECIHIIRPYHIDKLNIIKKGFQIINNKNMFFDELII